MKEEGNTGTWPTFVRRNNGSCMIVAVLQEKGGSGRTTIATNLAAVAHIEGQRSLVIDLDKQGSAFDWSLQRADDIASPLREIVVVRAAADDRNDRSKRPPLTAAKLTEMGKGYDAVFLDGPPRLDDFTLAAAVAADVVVMPVQPGPFDLWAAGSTLTLLDSADAVRAQIGKSPVRRLFVINRANPRETLTTETRAELESAGEIAGIVAQRAVFKKAAAKGEAVASIEPHGEAAREIRRVWRAMQ